MFQLPRGVFRLRSVLAGSVLVAAIASLGAWAQNQPAQSQPTAAAKVEQPPDAASRTDAVASGPPLRLGAGDVVNVNVYNAPDLSTTARVGDNGDLYLPLIGYVHIAGLTPEESQGVIEKRLDKGGFVRDPHVSLMVSHSGSQGVNVLGSVNHPGVFSLSGDHRILDVISAAGGFSTDAGRTVSVTHHEDPANPLTVVLPRDVTAAADNNVQVSSGDTVFVHKAEVIYVVGEVARPAGIYVDRDNLTVLQALALAGGPTHDAKLNGARIVRKGPDATSETPLPLKKILAAKSPDPALQANDILFIPAKSGFFNTASRGAQLALQATEVTYITAVR